MGFRHRNFPIHLEIILNPATLGWPTEYEASDCGDLGGNRLYKDLRGFDRQSALDVYEQEKKLIERIEQSSDPESVIEYIEESDFFYRDLFGLDLGVASSVCALSAIGCIPFSSCNAGAFGGNHMEAHPLVAFYARSPETAQILRCAHEAKIGLHAHDGIVVACARNVPSMMRFADEILSMGNAAFKVNSAD